MIKGGNYRKSQIVPTSTSAEGVPLGTMYHRVGLKETERWSCQMVEKV